MKIKYISGAFWPIFKMTFIGEQGQRALRHITILMHTLRSKIIGLHKEPRCLVQASGSSETLRYLPIRCSQFCGPMSFVRKALLMVSYLVHWQVVLVVGMLVGRQQLASRQVVVSQQVGSSQLVGRQQLAIKQVKQIVVSQQVEVGKQVEVGWQVEVAQQVDVGKQVWAGRKK